MHYNKHGLNIILCYNEDEFRLVRLIKILDELYEQIPYGYMSIIRKLKDDKGTLIIYWLEAPTLLYKMIINSLWMDHYEFHTKHIILDSNDYCKCCISQPQKEDPEIKAYLESKEFNLNYII